MIVRPATSADANEILALETALFGADAWSASSVLAELTAQDRSCAVAVSDGQVIGYVLTLRSGDVVDLQRIGVDPARQRQGVATALLEAALEQAHDDGADAMLLEVSEANGPALAFYAREGFVEIDRRRRYYRDGTDALILRRGRG